MSSPPPLPPRQPLPLPTKPRNPTRRHNASCNQTCIGGLPSLQTTPSMPVLVKAEVHMEGDGFLPSVSSYSSPDMHLLTFPRKTSQPSSGPKQTSSARNLMGPEISWESQSTRAIPNLYVSTEPKQIKREDANKLEQQSLTESQVYPPSAPLRTLPPLKVDPSAILRRRKSKRMMYLLWALVVALFVFVGVVIAVVPVCFIITRHLHP